jgi:hypothetical protein
MLYHAPSVVEKLIAVSWSQALRRQHKWGSGCRKISLPQLTYADEILKLTKKHYRKRRLKEVKWRGPLPFVYCQRTAAPAVRETPS